MRSDVRDSISIGSLGNPGVYPKKIWAGIFIFILSTLEYQTAVIYAAIVLSAWIFIDSECRITVKTVILEIVCGVITIGAGVLNMLSLSLLARLGVVKEAARSADVHDWVQKAAKCMTDLGQVLLNSRGLLPKVGLPFMVLCIAMGIVIWKFWKEKKLYAIIYYILLVVGMLAMVYLLPMLQPDTRTYPRIIWTFYSMPGDAFPNRFLAHDEERKRGSLLYMRRLFTGSDPVLQYYRYKPHGKQYAG